MQPRLLERAEQSSEFATKRGKAVDVVSVYVQLADQSPNRDQIWAEVEQDLIRLSASPTQDLRKVTPQQVIRMVTTTESEYTDIARYKRLVATVLAYALQREGKVTELSPMIDQPKYEQLKALHHEADIIAFTLNQPGVGRKLEQMPDLKASLESFQQYSTVRLFLEENKVPHNPNQIRKFNSDLRSYLFGHKTNHQIRTFLRKATFSRWLYDRTNWYGADQDEICESINKSAEFVCSNLLPVEMRAKAANIRLFLQSIMAQEFTSAWQCIYYGRRSGFIEMFVARNGTGMKRPDDISSVAETFNLFAKFNYYPQAFDSFIRKYIEEVDSLQSRGRLALDMYPDSFYTLGYKKRWVTEGLIFLENALFLKPKEAPSLENLTIDRRRELREFRQLSQKVLTDEQIRSQRS